MDDSRSIWAVQDGNICEPYLAYSNQKAEKLTEYEIILDKFSFTIN